MDRRTGGLAGTNHGLVRASSIRRGTALRARRANVKWGTVRPSRSFGRKRSGRLLSGFRRPNGSIRAEASDGLVSASFNALSECPGEGPITRQGAAELQIG